MGDRRHAADYSLVYYNVKCHLVLRVVLSGGVFERLAWTFKQSSCTPGASP